MLVFARMVLACLPCPGCARADGACFLTLSWVRARDWCLLAYPAPGCLLGRRSLRARTGVLINAQLACADGVRIGIYGVLIGVRPDKSTYRCAHVGEYLWVRARVRVLIRVMAGRQDVPQKLG